MVGSLDNLKVVEFAAGVAGPMIGKYLADFGATVVKVESMRKPEILRVSPPFKDGVPGVNRTGYFTLYNPNKYGLALDLAKAEGRDIAQRLILWADIVVDGFVPGTLSTWGLGYEEIARIKPDIIVVSTSNQGQTGADAQVRGYGTQLAAYCGFASLLGWPDRDPVMTYGGYTDILAPYFAVIATIVALEQKTEFGQGTHIDSSQVEAAMQFIAPLILDYQINGRIATRSGNSSPYAAPHGAFQCKGNDRWCAIAVLDDEQWKVFCDVIGNPEWSREKRFTTLKDRKENEDELNALVTSWTINFTDEQVMTQLQKAGIPSGKLATGKDLYDDQQLAHRGCLEMMQHPEIGECLHLGAPFKLSEGGMDKKKPAPCLGEHTEYVCKNILKMSDDEFLHLYTNGVFE